MLQEQDSFLALVSHQFKTPLASLQLSLETMAIRSLVGRAIAHAHRAHACGPGAHGRMVSQILDSARLERGRVDLKREPVELAGAVARVTGQFEERARNERIAISDGYSTGP